MQSRDFSQLPQGDLSADGLDDISHQALKELGQIAVDGCLPVIGEKLGISLQAGEAELKKEEGWVAHGPHLVGQVSFVEPVGGRIVLGLPLRLLQRENGVYTELLQAAEGNGTGLSTLEQAGPRAEQLLTGLFNALAFSFGSVCGGSFEWNQGRAGIVLSPEELSTFEEALHLVFPVQPTEASVTYDFSMAMEAELAEKLGELVLQNDGAHETAPTSSPSTNNEPVTDSDKVTYRRAYFQELGEGEPAEDRSHLDLLMDVPLEVTVELGRTHRQVREVLELGPGSVIELEKLAGEPVDIQINGRLIAKGEVVVVEENFGVRITDIVSPSDRVGPLT
jgi:flagellar motor switch protein FliN